MFGPDLLRVIDDRVRQLASPTSTATGTVSSRSNDFYDREAMVTFDGSQVPVPVRVSANVEVDAGDRVTLQRYGSVWWVTGCGTKHWPGGADISLVGALGTTTSGLYSDFPGSPSMTMTKRWDDTRLLLQLHTSAWVTVSETIIYAGFKLDSAGVTTFITVVHRFKYNVANTHLSFGGVRRWPDMPAGDYTITPQWSVFSGAGTLTQDTQDALSAFAAEIAP